MEIQNIINNLYIAPNISLFRQNLHTSIPDTDPEYYNVKDIPSIYMLQNQKTHSGDTDHQGLGQSSHRRNYSDDPDN